MTHLEDLWAQFPSSKPPTEAIMAASKSGRGVRSRRGGLLVAAAAAVAAGAVVTTSLTTGGSHGGASSAADGAFPRAMASPGLRYAAFQADLKPAASCDALLAAYQQRAMAKVTPYGWSGGVMYFDNGVVHGYSAQDSPAFGTALPGLTVPQAAAAQGLDATRRTPLGTSLDTLAATERGSVKTLGQANSATGTNIQEFGVDEPDSVKTNGTLIARLNGNTLAVYDASGSTITQRGVLALPYFNGGSILMAGTTVIAAGGNADPTATHGGTRVDTISLSNPDNPTITSSVVYGGGGITSLREQGSVIRLMMASGLPQLAFVQPQQGKRTNDQALAYNKQVVSRTTLKDWVPTYDTGGGPQQLLPCTDVAVPPAGVPLGTTSIVSFDASNATALNAVGVAGALSNAYESQHDIYLTVGPNTGGCYAEMCPVTPGLGRPCCFNNATSDLTTILQFKLDGLRTTHVATGVIRGTIRSSWSMDEFNGVLRVATTRYENNSPVNVIETMVPHGARLVRQGMITGLGRNQTLTATRWFNNLAIISTTNQVDPLYTIDLSDTAHPKQLGALHLPGDTQYIHPISDSRFLTISLQNVDREGMQSQVALFDTTNLADVKQLAQVSVGQNTSSLAAQDPKNFTWLPDRQIALSAFYGQGGIFLGAFSVGDTTLSSRRIALPMNASDARTFEVGNGKVVLVSGGMVSFLTM
jgi:hypothetical protein